MSEQICPVCKKPLYGPAWEGEDGTQMDLACADALLNTILAALNHKYTYTRTIAESLMDITVRRMARDAEDAALPPLLRLLEA